MQSTYFITIEDFDADKKKNNENQSKCNAKLNNVLVNKFGNINYLWH